MRQKRRHKLENQAELKRLRTRIENELKKENPNWDLLVATFAKIKVVFRHAQFANSENKTSFEEWIASAENRCVQKREPARLAQLRELEPLLIGVRDVVKHLDSVRSVYRERPDRAWKEIRNLNYFIKHTHFASASDKTDALKELHSFVDKIKDYKRLQRKRPDVERFLTIRQICKFAKEASAPILHAEIADGCIQNYEGTGCDPKIFNFARTTLINHQEMLERCSKKLHEAWEMYVEMTFLMLSDQKANTFKLLRDVQKQLHKAWDTWLERWRTLYVARMSELNLSAKSANECHALEYEYLCAQLARRHAHRLELEEKIKSWQDLRFRDDVEAWLNDEKQRIASLELKIRSLRRPAITPNTNP